MGRVDCWLHSIVACKRMLKMLGHTRTRNMSWFGELLAWVHAARSVQVEFQLMFDWNAQNTTCPHVHKSGKLSCYEGG